MDNAAGAKRQGIPHGIVTTYRKGVFRSRLEARWAAFFDLLRWRWIYEPTDDGEWTRAHAFSG